MHNKNNLQEFQMTWTNLLKQVQITLTACENKGMTLALEVMEKSERKEDATVSSG